MTLPAPVERTAAAVVPMPQAVYRGHPLLPGLDRELVHVRLFPGETLGAYLQRAGIWPRIRNRGAVVTIDGARVPRDLWLHCRPKPGTLIEIQVTVRGGSGGGKKNPLKTVLSLALIIAAPHIAVGLGGAAAGTVGALTTFGTILQAGIVVVGTMALNALFPPPKPNISRAQFSGGAAESPTYALNGGSNRMRPYEPMPVIMGTHRVTPDLGAKAYTEFEGEDQYLYQVFDFGYNDIDLSDFRIGQTPIENFSGVEIQQSGPDGALTLFPANIDTLQGSALTAAAGWIQRTSSLDATALAIEITGSLFHLADDGGIAALGATIEIEYRAVGSGTWLPFWEGASAINLSHARRAPLRRTFRISVASGQYEVRLRRTTPDETSDRNVSDLVWSQLRTYQPDTADYTGRKRVALKIKASGQLNGQVDQLNAIARAKTEMWNGSSWVTAQTSNPAWWILAAARGRFVAGRRIWGAGMPDSRIGLDNLIEFAAWCDARQLQFNAVFDQQMSVQDMIDAIALCGRATVSIGTGKLEAVWDAPDQPVVAVISMSNIVRDSFEIEYTTGNLADEVVLSFINPDLDWQRDVVRKMAPGVTEPRYSRNVEYFGCTKKAQAGEACNLYIAANEFRTRRYRWRMDWEGMPLSRGEVAALSHDLASYDYSGRLVPGSTASSLKLERTVPLSAAGSFVTLVKPDGTFATYNVAAGAGDSDTLNLVNPLAFNPGADPDHPVHDYRWLYGHTATPGRKIKIDAMRPIGHDRIELTAIDEVPEYYAAAEDDFIYTTPAPVFGSADISNLQAVEDGIRVGNGYLARVTLTWDAGSDYSFAEVRVSVDGGPLELYGDTIARSFEFKVRDGAALVIEVTAFPSLGRKLARSTKQTITKTVNFAGLYPPSNVPNFSISGRTLSWPVAPEVDVVGHGLRFHRGDRRTWEDALPLVDGLITENPYTPEALPYGQISIGIKAFDADDQESPEAAWIVANLGDPSVQNVTEEIDLEALGWPGTVSGGSIIGDDIVADNTTAFYSNDSDPLYTTAGALMYPASSYDALTYETDIIVPAAELAGSRLTIPITLTGDPTYLEYRKTGPGPLFSTDDADLFYSGDDTDPFYDPAPGYLPWPGEILLNRETYQFRVRTGQGATEGRLAAMVLSVDVPDLEETVDNLVISPGGTRIPLAVDFAVIKNIQLTLEDDGGSAVSARILDKNAALGPLIECIDQTQASVAGRIDARIKGY